MVPQAVQIGQIYLDSETGAFLDRLKNKIGDIFEDASFGGFFIISEIANAFSENPICAVYGRHLNAPEISEYLGYVYQDGSGSLADRYKFKRSATKAEIAWLGTEFLRQLR